jgi:hypothetical protein
MRTQEQAAFGHNVQTITTYSNEVKVFGTCTVGRAFSMRVERFYSGDETPTICFCELFSFPHYSCKAKQQCQATPVEFGSPRMYVHQFSIGMSIYIHQFIIPNDFRA